MATLLHNLVENAANSSPEKVALIHKDHSMTYIQVYEHVIKLQKRLIDLGVRKGDRICLYLEKRFEKVISIFAISMSGGIAVPIRHVAKIQQLIYIIQNCRPKVLITKESRIHSIIEYAQHIPTVTSLISIGQLNGDFSIKELKLSCWEDIMKTDSSSKVDVPIAENDLAAILYTSGSTGSPKGVILSHLNILSGTKKVSQYLNIQKDDRILSILTFAFDYGLNQLTTAFLNCAQLILLDYLFPQDIVRSVEKYKISGIGAVATTWIQLLQASWKNTSMDQLRYITNSGGSIPVNCVLELKRRLPNTDIYLMYGLTEAFRSTYLDPSLIEKIPNSIGKAIPGEEILVLDENEKPVTPGQIGELVHRGVLVSQGYWGDPERTAVRFRPNPLQPKEVPIPEMVVYSGDYVRMDEDGFLYFIGRRDEMIKCAGNRISPTEVEEIVYQFEFIRDAVALGVPHDVYGQSVFMVASLRPGADIDVAGIKKRCIEKMPSFMVPSRIEIWDEIPRNINEKLDRAAVKMSVFQKFDLKKEI